MKDYESIVNGFFDDFEENTKGALKLRKAFWIIMLALVIWFFVGAAVAEAAGNYTIAYSVIASLVLLVLGIFVIRPKIRDKVEDKIDDENIKFFDEVYMKILASELNASIGSESHSTSLDRKVCLEGEINGRPYTLKEEKETIFEEKTTLSNGTEMIMRNKRYPMTISLRSKHLTAEKIVLNSCSDPIDGLSTIRKVTMDSKRFNFDVRCNDSVEAYKILTADAMEKISRWSELCNIQGIELKNHEIIAYSKTNLINIDYNPFLSKSVKRNRKNYTADFIVKEVSESVSGIKQFVSNAPFADFNRT